METIEKCKLNITSSSKIIEFDDSLFVNDIGAQNSQCVSIEFLPGEHTLRLEHDELTQGGGGVLGVLGSWAHTSSRKIKIEDFEKLYFIAEKGHEYMIDWYHHPIFQPKTKFGKALLETQYKPYKPCIIDNSLQGKDISSLTIIERNVKIKRDMVTYDVGIVFLYHPFCDNMQSDTNQIIIDGKDTINLKCDEVFIYLSKPGIKIFTSNLSAQTIELDIKPNHNFYLEFHFTGEVLQLRQVKEDIGKREINRCILINKEV